MVGSLRTSRKKKKRRSSEDIKTCMPVSIHVIIKNSEEHLNFLSVSMSQRDIIIQQRTNQFRIN